MAGLDRAPDDVVMGRFRIRALDGSTHEDIPGSKMEAWRSSEEIANVRSGAKILPFMWLDGQRPSIGFIRGIEVK
jgi:hypothetical protein